VLTLLAWLVTGSCASTSRQRRYCLTGRESTPHILFIQLNKITIGTGILHEEQKGTATLRETRRHIFCSYSRTRLPPVSYPKNKLPCCVGIDSRFSVHTAEQDNHVTYPKNELPRCVGIDSTFSVYAAEQDYHVSYPKNKTATQWGNRFHIFGSYSRTRKKLPCCVGIDFTYRISCSYSRTRLPPVSYLKKKRSTAMLGHNWHHIFCSYSQGFGSGSVSGSALIWVAGSGSGSAFKLLIRIRIQEGKNDPQK
jgi:hypothetical protein